MTEEESDDNGGMWVLVALGVVILVILVAVQVTSAHDEIDCELANSETLLESDPTEPAPPFREC